MCLSQVIATTSFEQPLYPDLYKFGGLIADLEIGPGVCRPPEPEVSTKAHFYLPVGILMAYDPSTPFQKIGS
jgi:hypothetical protein